MARGFRQSNPRRSKKKSNRARAKWKGLVGAAAPSAPVRRVFRAIAWTGLLTGVALLALIGLPELRNRAIARDLIRTPEAGVGVSFVNRPALLEGAELDLLVATVRSAVGERTSPLLHGGLQDAAAALRATGWFSSSPQLRWRNDNSIEVDGAYVLPVAVVRSAGADVLVDTQGRRLPLTYTPGYAPLPVIRGAAQPSPNAFGVPWTGGDVQAGLALLNLVHTQPWFDSVRAIDVARFQREGLLALRTLRCTIIWGRSPTDTTVQEVPVQQKLDYLDYLFRQYGAIDAACGGGELDIRRDVVTAGVPR